MKLVLDGKAEKYHIFKYSFAKAYDSKRNVGYIW